MENIDWEKQKDAVIKRVFERGNEIEKIEIVRFYGQDNVNNILNMHAKQTSLQHNQSTVIKYIKNTYGD